MISLFLSRWIIIIVVVAEDPIFIWMDGIGHFMFGENMEPDQKQQQGEFDLPRDGTNDLLMEWERKRYGNFRFVGSCEIGRVENQFYIGNTIAGGNGGTNQTYAALCSVFRMTKFNAREMSSSIDTT